jgi:hypothetical protein
VVRAVRGSLQPPLHEGARPGNEETYYDYVCSECYSIVLNIERANAAERETLAPDTSLD